MNIKIDIESNTVVMIFNANMNFLSLITCAVTQVRLCESEFLGLRSCLGGFI